jgi:hypothetical protein
VRLRVVPRGVAVPRGRAQRQPPTACRHGRLMRHCSDHGRRFPSAPDHVDDQPQEEMRELAGAGDRAHCRPGRAPALSSDRAASELERGVGDRSRSSKQPSRPALLPGRPTQERETRATCRPRVPVSPRSKSRHMGSCSSSRACGDGNAVADARACGGPGRMSAGGVRNPSGGRGRGVGSVGTGMVRR